jgi:glycosyltransferase involved in cell wall biosynthesis
MKVLLFANTDWYLYNFRLNLANYLKQQGLEVVLVSPAGSYGSRLQAKGFRWIPINMERSSLNVCTEFKLLIHLTKLYLKESPDFVHHFTLKCVIYGSIAARLAGIQRQINAITGLGHVFISNNSLAHLLRPFVSFLLRIVLHSSKSRLILQNHDDYNIFTQTSLSKPQTTRLIRSSGVDTDKFKQLRLHHSRGKFKVLLATRLLWEKGVGEYIEAARLCHSDAMEFLLAGSPDDGNPASVPAKQIMIWQTEGIINYIGHIDNIENILSKVDLVVLPSYREGVPRILLEAAACGLPIVTTDAPGCREIVVNGVNGLLVPCKDYIALAKAIEYMKDHLSERIRMGAASRAKVVKEFAQNIVLKKTFDVYKELL